MQMSIRQYSRGCWRN